MGRPTTTNKIVVNQGFIRGGGGWDLPPPPPQPKFSLLRNSKFIYTGVWQYSSNEHMTLLLPQQIFFVESCKILNCGAFDLVLCCLVTIGK